MPPTKESFSVLVVDDDEVHCYSLQKLLQRLGWSVSCAFDGTTAAALAKQGKFDAVLLDMHLPDFDGLEVLTQVRRADIPQPAVIFHSASGWMGPGDAEFDGFLTYPVDVEHIDAVLRGAIQKRRDQKHKAE